MVMGVQGLMGSIPLDGGVNGLYSGLAVRVYQSPKKFKTMDWGSIGHVFLLLPRTLERLTREKGLDLPTNMPSLTKHFLPGIIS